MSARSPQGHKPPHRQPNGEQGDRVSPGNPACCNQVARYAGHNKKQGGESKKSRRHSHRTDRAAIGSSPPGTRACRRSRAHLARASSEGSVPVTGELSGGQDHPTTSRAVA